MFFPCDLQTCHTNVNEIDVWTQAIFHVDKAKDLPYYTQVLRRITFKSKQSFLIQRPLKTLLDELTLSIETMNPC